MSRNKTPIQANSVEEHRLRGKRKGALLKEQVGFENGKVVGYALAYINLKICSAAELLRILSSERVRLLRQVKGASLRVSELALGLRRDVRAVSRDVSLLEKAGLLRTRYELNPGHGRLKVVESVAREYRLVASL